MSIQLKKINPQLLIEKPERQYKYLLIYCESGSISIEIDEDFYDLQAHQAITVTAKQYLQWLEINQTTGYILEFTYDFFCKDEKTMELIYYNGLYCHFGLNEVIHLPNELMIQKIEQYFADIAQELALEGFEYLAKLHSITKLMIIDVSRCKIIQQKRPLYQPNALFLKFLNLIRDNFQAHYTIKQIAEQLGISEAKLTELCKTITNESPQQIINNIYVLEAKRLFRYQRLTVKEVAFALGFNDPYYFSRFFKKHTSERPKDYLRQALEKTGLHLN
jgi:AraC family transcriptional regulator, transcriptional activator of pobA